jgi:hypothetical protein
VFIFIEYFSEKILLLQNKVWIIFKIIWNIDIFKLLTKFFIKSALREPRPEVQTWLSKLCLLLLRTTSTFNKVILFFASNFKNLIYNFIDLVFICKFMFILYARKNIKYLNNLLHNCFMNDEIKYLILRMITYHVMFQFFTKY